MDASSAVWRAEEGMHDLGKEDAVSSDIVVNSLCCHTSVALLSGSSAEKPAALLEDGFSSRSLRRVTIIKHQVQAKEC